MKALSLIKGLGIGFVAGAVVTAAVVPMDKRRLARTKAGRAIRCVGQAVEGINDAFCH